MGVALGRADGVAFLFGTDNGLEETDLRERITDYGLRTKKTGGPFGPPFGATTELT